ncbi:MAG: 16S rRNA (cytidine(1402)-2'-O)-methyltransferase [Pontimonas sp.]
MLILAATPLGNLGDASPRLVEALSSADFLVAEDTRVLRKLMAALGVSNDAPVFSAHEHSEGSIAEEIWTRAVTEDVLVVSDAGMPAISDPGFVLARGARERGIPISVIPGPSAGISALAVSGLPTDRFTHEGFVPKKGRVGYFESLAGESRTMVFFESPHRLHEMLLDAASVFGGEREACVAREITKKFEEIQRGTLAELAGHFSGSVKGEIVVVMGGATAGSTDLPQAVIRVSELMDSGMGRSEACQVVAKETGIPKSTLYKESVGDSA